MISVSIDSGPIAMLHSSHSRIIGLDKEVTAIDAIPVTRLFKASGVPIMDDSSKYLRDPAVRGPNRIIELQALSKMEVSI